MTTLTVYFASTSAPPPVSSSPSTMPNAISTALTTAIPIASPVQAPNPVQDATEPISIPLEPPSLAIPSSSSPVLTPFPSRTSSKRNRTFFERFNQAPSAALVSNPQSPSYQPSQSPDSSNALIDPPPRLRRRFTFRRSLRHSVHSKGGDAAAADEGIRSVRVRFGMSSYFFSHRYLFNAPLK